MGVLWGRLPSLLTVPPKGKRGDRCVERWKWVEDYQHLVVKRICGIIAVAGIAQSCLGRTVDIRNDRFFKDVNASQLLLGLFSLFP